MPKKHTSAFQKTARIIDESKNVGFQWKGLSGPLKKVREELRELEHEIKLDKSTNKTRISEELGDLLFSVCNLASMLGLNPEASLHSTLDRFQSRFRFVKSELAKNGKTPRESNLKEMQDLWQKAKRRKK